MSTQAVIFIGVTGYMLAMLAVGYYASRRARSLADFVVAGRGLPLWLCSMTVIATWFGGSVMIGGAGAAYADGLLGVIEDPFGGALALFLVGLFFARLFRRLKVMTVADFMDQRYGRAAAVAITVTGLVGNIMWVGSMLVAFGLIFEQLTGTPLEVGIFSGALVIFVYTSIGGMWAVAITDFLQMLIIMVGLVVLLVAVLIDVGGWGSVAAQLEEGTFRMIPVEMNGESWLNYLRAWVIIGIGDLSAQTLFQRAAAAKSERVAVRSFYIGGFGYLLFGMIPVLLGIIGSVSMPELPASESVLPALALEHLHPVAIAVFVGALLAAIMSSGDSALLACASLIARNVLPLVRKAPPEKLTLRVARWSIPACGIIAIVVALKIRVVYDLAVDANILGVAAIIVPFIVGAWWRKANRTGALSAMAAGISAWLATLYLAPQLPADFIGMGVSLLTMLVVVPLTQRFDPPRELRDNDGNRVERTHRLGVIRE
jgi:SSS family transporter